MDYGWVASHHSIPPHLKAKGEWWFAHISLTVRSHFAHISLTLSSHRARIALALSSHFARIALALSSQNAYLLATVPCKYNCNFIATHSGFINKNCATVDGGRSTSSIAATFLSAASS